MESLPACEMANCASLPIRLRGFLNIANKTQVAAFSVWMSANLKAEQPNRQL